MIIHGYIPTLTAWQWRKAVGGFIMPGEDPNNRFFHAYDESDHAACTPSMMCGNREKPTDDSALCMKCFTVVMTDTVHFAEEMYV